MDVPFEVDTGGERQRYLLIDTAGIRKTRSVSDSIEFFSVKRAEESIERCDLAILVLDAESGILEQDKKVADRIVQAHKACIVVVNKWDLIEETVRLAREEEIERRRNKDNPHGPKPMTTLSEFGAWVQDHLFFLDYAPVIFTSAKSGFHLDRLLEAVRYVARPVAAEDSHGDPEPHPAGRRRAAATRQLARPPARNSFTPHRSGSAPPTFLLFVNRDELFSAQYQKYLADQMRRAFGYEGCPLVLVPKSRPQTIEPVRKFRKRRKEETKRPGRRRTRS